MDDAIVAPAKKSSNIISRRSSEPRLNQNNSAGTAYWWKMPDDTGPLQQLKPLELKLWIEISRAIQRDQGKGLISLRQLQERVHSGSLGRVSKAVDTICNPNFEHHFTRYRPGTDFQLRPGEWKGRAGVEYRPNFQWKEKDTGECSPKENSPARVGVNVLQKESGMFSKGEQHLESLESTDFKDTHTSRSSIAECVRAEPPVSRFEEFWQRYPRQQHRDAAARAWVSVTTPENETALFACLDRYVRSDEVSRNVVANPENWLLRQSRDGWSGTWPAVKGTGGSAVNAPAPRALCPEWTADQIAEAAETDRLLQESRAEDVTTEAEFIQRMKRKDAASAERYSWERAVGGVQ